MEERIQEFIADYIPKRITKETRYKLQAELENHIYERIDYYTEIGYSGEESLEKALKDFGDDKETKEQIKKNLENIHIPWSLADFFAKSLPISVAIIFFGGIILHFMFRLTDIMLVVIIPLTLWLAISFIKRLKKPHHIVKSVISFILVIPYFTFLGLIYFVGNARWNVHITEKKVFESYENNITFYETYNFPNPNELGFPIDSFYFSIEEDTIFSAPFYENWIFEYSPTEYKDLKEKFNEELIFMETYTEDGYFVDNVYYDEPYRYNCTFSVYGFVFKTIQFPLVNEKITDDEDNYRDDCWALIGTNDKTHEIAFIFLEPISFTPSFDEHFIKEDCGWRYFYFLTKF